MSDGAISKDWYEYRYGWEHVDGEVVRGALVT